jgi:hypothetical protein
MLTVDAQSALIESVYIKQPVYTYGAGIAQSV